MAHWGWIPVWSETCRGKRILYDFNVFLNKYVHVLVTIDTDFIRARFNYETLYHGFVKIQSKGYLNIYFLMTEWWLEPHWRRKQMCIFLISRVH